MRFTRHNGATSNLFRVTLRSSITGQGLTGLTNASTGLVISTIADVEASATAYTVAGSTVDTIATLGTFAAPTASHCRFKEVDSTNHPGLYELQLADARFAVSNARQLNVTISGATNLLCKEIVIQLTATDVDDGVHGGMTALPNAAANANGGLPVLSSSGTTLAYTISTLTTYTGNTPQTGDAFARLGAPAGASIAADLAEIEAETDGIAAIPTSNPSAVAIATAVWQDTTSGDFTVAGSIGKSLFTSGSAPGAASGLALVGSNVGTATSVSGAVGSVTGNVGGNVVGSVASVVAAVTLSANDSPVVQSGTAQAGGASTITLASGASATDHLYEGQTIKTTGGTGAGQVRVIAGYVGATKVATVDHAWQTNPDATTTYAVLATNAPKLDGNLAATAGTVSDKTGYSLSQAFPANFASLAISGGGAVTVGTNNDKSGYSLTQAFPTNFASFAITAGGAVTVGTNSDKTGYSLSQAFPTNFAALGITSGGHIATVDALTGNTPQTGDAFARLGAPVGASISADVAGVPNALLDLTNGIETGVTPRQAIRYVAAACVGALAGAATTSITISAIGNSGTSRIAATVDASGNRSAVTLS